MPLMTLRQYATERGLSIPTIRERIQRGTISKDCLINHGLPSQMIDSEKADAYYAAHSMDNYKRNKGPASDDKERVDPDDPSPRTARERLNKANADKEEARAKLFQLELEEAQGKLVNVEELRSIADKIYSEVKDAILNVPAKVAPDLLAMNNVVEIESRLYKELNLALEALSRMLSERHNTL